MATTVLTQHPIGAPFSGTIHNNNLQIVENSFADLGPYVISGLTFSAGTGLSVSVVAGTASIGGRVTVASTFVIAGLVDATTNHIYLLNTGAGTSNTTGTPPANSVKLGTAVTAGGVVTVVAMGRTSGRQQFQQPQNLVLGGPSAGTASAGHPRAGNLAQWNATQAEGFEFFGTLPAGAVSLSSAVILAPNSIDRNLIQPTNDAYHALGLKQHTATQSGALLPWVSDSGGFLGAITGAGKVEIGAAAGAVNAMLYVEANNSLSQGLVLKAPVGNTSTLLAASDTNGFLWQLSPAGNGGVVSITSYDPTDNAVGIRKAPAQSVETLVIVEPATFNTAFTIDQNDRLVWWGTDDAAGNHIRAIAEPQWADSTAAAWKGRLLFKAVDFNGERECLRIQGSGAAAMIGFLGATAVVRPTGTTDLRTALINLGLYTTGGASPLNLNGGLLTAGQITCPDSGSFSEHFGASSQATGTDGTAVGFDARANGSDSTSVGTGSRASAATTTAVGVGAQATGAASVSIGASSTASGADALAFGRSASATGDDSVAIGISTSVAHNKSFAIGAQATTTTTNQMVIGSSFSPIATIYAGNGVTNASPAGFIFNATGGSGANVAGANLTVAGGQGTGSAAGGAVVVQSSLAGGAGSTANALHELARISNVGVLSLTQLTSVQDRTAFDLTPSWATATDATRKARAVFNVWDTAAREAIRLEASGTAAMIGFLGAAAVVRQTAAAAATDLATVITLANSLRTGLIANGLFV